MNVDMSHDTKAPWDSETSRIFRETSISQEQKNIGILTCLTNMSCHQLDQYCIHVLFIHILNTKACKIVMLTCLTNTHARCGCCSSVNLLTTSGMFCKKTRQKYDHSNTDLFDKDVCQVWLLELGETADHLLQVAGAQVLLYGGHRCRLVAHSFCLAPRGAAVRRAAC